MQQARLLTGISVILSTCGVGRLAGIESKQIARHSLVVDGWWRPAEKLPEIAQHVYPTAHNSTDSCSEVQAFFCASQHVHHPSKAISTSICNTSNEIRSVRT